MRCCTPPSPSRPPPSTSPGACICTSTASPSCARTPPPPSRSALAHAAPRSLTIACVAAKVLSAFCCFQYYLETGGSLRLDDSALGAAPRSACALDAHAARPPAVLEGTDLPSAPAASNYKPGRSSGGYHGATAGDDEDDALYDTGVGFDDEDRSGYEEADLSKAAV